MISNMDEYTSEMADNGHDEQSSFGIKKIIDVKLNSDGKQLYKVKWEPTWEPVENLASCQHLIDEFWSFVNKAKQTHEGSAQKRPHPHQNMASNMNMNTEAKFARIPEDDKSEVQRLIARTNQTQVGQPPLVSPTMMFQQQNQHMSYPNHQFQTTPKKPKMGHQEDQKPFAGTNPLFPTSSPSQKPKTSVPKTESTFSPGKDKSSCNSALKYVENFENPYVKIILVCKICNKEQSLKFSSNWKKHYLSHASNEEKPHHCSYCSKAFITLTAKNKHIKSQHGNMGAQQVHSVKEEEAYSMY